MIEPITVFQVRCDHQDHAENPDDDGLHRWDGDETTIWGSRDEALASIRTEGWQATIAGTFCPDHVNDAGPLEQPGLNLFDSVAFDAIIDGLTDDPGSYVWREPDNHDEPEDHAAAEEACPMHGSDEPS